MSDTFCCLVKTIIKVCDFLEIVCEILKIVCETLQIVCKKRAKRDPGSQDPSFFPTLVSTFFFFFFFFFLHEDGWNRNFFYDLHF